LSISHHAPTQTATRPPRSIKEHKDAKKAAEKEKKAAERERKQEEAQVRLATMTEEERVAHEQRRKVRSVSFGLVCSVGFCSI